MSKGFSLAPDQGCVDRPPAVMVGGGESKERVDAYPLFYIVPVIFLVIVGQFWFNWVKTFTEEKIGKSLESTHLLLVALTATVLFVLGLWVFNVPFSWTY